MNAIQIAVVATVVLGAVAGVIAGWIKRPQRLPIWGTILALVLVVGAGAVIQAFVLTGPATSADAGSVHSTGAGAPTHTPATPVMTTNPLSSTNSPSAGSSGGPGLSPGTGGAHSGPSSSGGAGNGPRTGTTAPQPDQYVPASAFRQFGTSYGSFPYGASGTRLTIGSTGDYYERGALLTGWRRCSTTISFDVRMDLPSTITDASYGFGVLPRAASSQDQAIGDLLMWHPADYPKFIATWSTEPTPGHGGFGFDWHDVPDPGVSQHVVVTVKDNEEHATVNGRLIPNDAASAECGDLLFIVWGGATIYVDRVSVT
jgi:hypothetical protein